MVARTSVAATATATRPRMTFIYASATWTFFSVFSPNETKPPVSYTHLVRVHPAAGTVCDTEEGEISPDWDRMEFDGLTVYMDQMLSLIHI